MNAVTTEKIIIPRSALFLGSSGLVPFVVLSLLLWWSPPHYAEQIQHALWLYAAIILSFMGAVHWGVAMAKPYDSDTGEPDKRMLLLSVIPALVAWFASFVSGLAQWSILYIAFTGLCVLDTESTKRGDLPAWYPMLRVPLTIIVVLSLINAQLAIAID